MPLRSINKIYEQSIMTDKLSNITRLLILILITVSCISKEDSEKIKRDKLQYDSEEIKDSTKSIISRIDNSKIEASLLDTRIISLMDSAKVTGLALSVINKNQIIYRKAFGYANYKKRTLLQINNTFYGASLSKAILDISSLTWLMMESLILTSHFNSIWIFLFQN
jgi:hypothetical protein